MRYMPMPILLQLILIGFIISTVIQLIYWGIIFRKVIVHRPLQEKIKIDIPVSVIICAKNEAANLRKYLPSILSQDYPKYEVIVVNDHSADDSMAVLSKMSDQYSYLRIIDLSEKNADYIGKKMALSTGIAQATHEWLLLTDADCQPVSNQWIREMMATTIHKDKEIGLGYSPYIYEKGLLNAFVRYETLLTAFQYINMALIKQPYMGVGRNLLYRKDLFYQAGGFESHLEVASGDDDLFISEVATGNNTFIVDTPDAVVYSEPKKTWSSWLAQKRRHLSTGKHYRPKIQILLGLFSITHFFHVFFLVLLLIFNFGTVVAIVGSVLRTLIIVLMCTAFRKKFREVNDWYWIPLLDFLYPFYYMALARYLISTKTKSWK
ncbi:MAG TPA: glycosyltransferase [Saprospiraceae bacterium]|nr:glycosyltransferase [Saprospiraceae bacterium]